MTLFYGVGAVSMTIIISAFMLGLGVGALVAGFAADRLRSVVRAYLLVELALGVFGTLSVDMISWIGTQTGGASMLATSLIAFGFFCLPTLLMGATLPLIVTVFESRWPSLIQNVSLLYFINTAGAAAGALLSAFVLISFLGIGAAVYFASGLNILCALLIAIVARQRTATPSSTRGSVVPRTRRIGLIALLIAFVTGFLGLGYEIVWLRLIGVFVKDSPYAFSAILCVYLFSIGVGSWAAHSYVKASHNHRSLLFSAQFLIGVYVIVSTAIIYQLIAHTEFRFLAEASFRLEAHPNFPPRGGPLSTSALGVAWSFIDLLFWPTLFLVVPASLMGAMFPLLVVLSGVPKSEGLATGLTYALTVAGNVAGAAITGFLILPALGTERTLLSFGYANILLALTGAAYLFRRRWVIISTAATLLATLVFPHAGDLYRQVHIPRPDMTVELTEGIEGVVLTQFRDEVVLNYINGQGHGGRPGLLFYYEAAETLSRTPTIESILVVGYGTGSIVEAALASPEVQSVSVVEINETLMRNLRKIPLFASLLADPRLKLIFDDARRALLKDARQYDAILIDPLRSRTAYSGNLYSREFFELAASRLTPKGSLLVWLDETRVIPNTVIQVFKYARLYDRFIIASNNPLHSSDATRWHTIIRTVAPAHIDGTLESQYPYRGDEAFIRRINREGVINTDLRPRTEYYIGLISVDDTAE